MYFNNNKAKKNFRGNSSDFSSNKNNITRRKFFKRKKTSPFAGPNAIKIDYKDIRVLQKFLTERGKIIPSRISAVGAKNQRELSTAIKRARFLALLPYVNQ